MPAPNQFLVLTDGFFPIPTTETHESKNNNGDED
jgi:hypothetical protein